MVCVCRTKGFTLAATYADLFLRTVTAGLVLRHHSRRSAGASLLGQSILSGFAGIGVEILPNQKHPHRCYFKSLSALPCPPRVVSSLLHVLQRQARAGHVGVGGSQITKPQWRRCSIQWHSPHPPRSSLATPPPHAMLRAPGRAHAHLQPPTRKGINEPQGVHSMTRAGGGAHAAPHALNIVSTRWSPLRGMEEEQTGAPLTGNAASQAPGPGEWGGADAALLHREVQQWT